MVNNLRLTTSKEGLQPFLQFTREASIKNLELQTLRRGAEYSITAAAISEVAINPVSFINLGGTLLVVLFRCKSTPLDSSKILTYSKEKSFQILHSTSC